jgi:hypothetical protein
LKKGTPMAYCLKFWHCHWVRLAARGVKNLSSALANRKSSMKRKGKKSLGVELGSKNKGTTGAVPLHAARSLFGVSKECDQ